MNWGLFAALTGFLLPLSIAIRLSFNMAWDGRWIGHPLQAGRLVALLFVGLPITGKVASIVFAVTGRYGDVGQLTIDFMVTGWGLAHLVVTLAAVLAFELLAPRIAEHLDRGEPSAARPTAGYLVRDAVVLLLILVLAWIGAR